MAEQNVAGTGYIKAFLVGLFIISVILFALILAGNNLKTAGEETQSIRIINETGAYLNSSGYSLAYSSLKDFTPTIEYITNESIGILNSGNYTLTGGILYNATAETYSDVNVTYTFTYSVNSAASSIMGNLTSGAATIGTSIPTWITLAALVVLISIIVIIVLVVNKMNSGKGSL